MLLKKKILHEIITAAVIFGFFIKNRHHRIVDICHQ